MYEDFFTNFNIDQGEGRGWTIFLHGTYNLLIKLDSVPKILSTIVAFHQTIFVFPLDSNSLGNSPGMRLV